MSLIIHDCRGRPQSRRRYLFLIIKVCLGTATSLHLPANKFRSLPQRRVSGRTGLVVALVVGPRHHQLLHTHFPAALCPVWQLQRPRRRRQAPAAPVHHATFVLLYELHARRGRNPLVQLVPAVQILLGIVAVTHQLPGAAAPAEQVEPSTLRPTLFTAFTRRLF